MPETESKPADAFRGLVDLSNEILDLCKNLAIVLFVVLFFFWGGYLRQKLDDAGFKLTEVGPFKLEDAKRSSEQAKAAASDLDAIKQKLGDLELKLTEAESHNPAAGVALAPLKSDVANLRAQANSADATLKTSIIAQQDLIRKAAPQAAAKAVGWIYLGQVDESKTRWAGVGAVNVSMAVPTFQSEQRITLSSDVYLHSSPPSGTFHTQGGITDVLPANSVVEVIEPDFSHAKAGGWFVWLKVRSL